MGAAIAVRLAGAGVHPLCWDLSDGARARAQAAGVGLAPDACAVAQASDIVLTTITDDAGVNGLFHGPRGFLEADLAGKLFIEMSTLRPQTVRDLAPVLAQRGAAIVDSPVLGTIPSVQEGKLLSLAGGASSDLDRARPLLETLARAIVHVGPLGSGHAMKLAVNLTMAAYIQAIGEGLALGAAHGLEIGAMLNVFSGSPLANGILANKLAAFSGEPTPLTLDIRTLRKDVQSAVAAGTAVGAPMSVSAATLDILASAVAAGWGERDCGEIAPFIRNHLMQ